MPPMTSPLILALLEKGDIDLEGQFLWGSNYTLLVDVTHEGETRQAVYKPSRGERPLWDFPRASLAMREVAAYLVSEHIGWKFVPPTVYRSDGPLGEGSLQLFVEHDPEYHYFNFKREDTQRLRPVALFDFLINNADRKGGHILVSDDAHIWLIDHGICFHQDPKLRTVLWDFAGEPLPEALCADLQRFRRQIEPESPFYQQIRRYLSPGEIRAMSRRADWLLESGVFPQPPKHARPYPWPLI